MAQNIGGNHEGIARMHLPQTPKLMLSRAVRSRIALVCGSREPSGVHVSARYWSAVLYTYR